MNMFNKFFLLASSLMILFLGLTPTLAGAIDCSKVQPKTTTEAIQCGTDQTADTKSSTDPGQKIDTTIQNVINLLSVAVGIAAVVMLIIGGFRYVTSAGNAETTKAAKNTILYALTGLVIVALAQLIVNFVLNKTTQPPPKPTSLINPRGV